MSRLTPEQLRELLEFSTLEELVGEDDERKNADFADSDEFHPAFDLDFLDALDADAITPEERSRFARHLVECPRCAAQIALQMKFGGLFADEEEGEEEDADEEEPEAAKDKIASFAEIESERAPTVLKSKREQREETRRVAVFRFPVWKTALSLACVACGIVGIYKLRTATVQNASRDVASVITSSRSSESFCVNSAVIGENSNVGGGVSASTFGDSRFDFQTDVSRDVGSSQAVSRGLSVERGFGSRTIGKGLGSKTVELENDENAALRRLRTLRDAKTASDFSARLTDWGYRNDGTKEKTKYYASLIDVDASQKEKIIAAYEAAIESAPDDKEPALEFAWYLVEIRSNDEDLERAEELFREASPNAIEKELALGVCAFLRGDDSTAQKRFRKALEDDPTNETARQNLEISVARENLSRQNADETLENAPSETVEP